MLDDIHLHLKYLPKVSEKESEVGKSLLRYTELVENILGDYKCMIIDSQPGFMNPVFHTHMTFIRSEYSILRGLVFLEKISGKNMPPLVLHQLTRLHHSLRNLKNYLDKKHSSR